MRSLLALLVLTATASADPAAANKTPDVRAMHTDDCARARKENKPCVLDMKGEELDGPVVKLDDTKVQVLTTTKQPSLIKVRRDFIVEILKTAEDL